LVGSDAQGIAKIKCCGIIRNLAAFPDSSSVLIAENPGIIDLLKRTVVLQNADEPVANAMSPTSSPRSTTLDARVHAMGALANFAMSRNHALAILADKGESDAVAMDVIAIIFNILQSTRDVSSKTPSSRQRGITHPSTFDLWEDNDAKDDLHNKAINCLVNLVQHEECILSIISSLLAETRNQSSPSPVEKPNLPQVEAEKRTQLDILLELLSVPCAVCVKATIAVGCLLPWMCTHLNCGAEDIAPSLFTSSRLALVSFDDIGWGTFVASPQSQEDRINTTATAIGGGTCLTNIGGSQLLLGTISHSKLNPFSPTQHPSEGTSQPAAPDGQTGCLDSFNNSFISPTTATPRYDVNSYTFVFNASRLLINCAAGRPTAGILYTNAVPLRTCAYLLRHANLRRQFQGGHALESSEYYDTTDSDIQKRESILAKDFVDAVILAVTDIAEAARVAVNDRFQNSSLSVSNSHVLLSAAECLLGMCLLSYEGEIISEMSPNTSKVCGNDWKFALQQEVLISHLLQHLGSQLVRLDNKPPPFAWDSSSGDDIDVRMVRNLSMILSLTQLSKSHENDVDSADSRSERVLACLAHNLFRTVVAGRPTDSEYQCREKELKCFIVVSSVYRNYPGSLAAIQSVVSECKARRLNILPFEVT
jgi:hypothetical protein